MTITLDELAVKFDALERRVQHLERPAGALESDATKGLRYAVTDGMLWVPGGAEITPAIEWPNSPNQGGRAKPRKLILIHYTGGRSFEHTTRWFMRDSSSVSSHVVVSKLKGDPVRQFVNLRRRAWHAGKSEWQDKSSCNGFALGIELDNAGPLKPGPAGVGFVNRWGEVVEVTYQHDDGTVWEDFPNHQLVTAAEIVLAMAQDDDSIVAVVGHQHVALPQGRKIDPGPAFPWENFGGALAGANLAVWPQVASS